MKFYLLTFLLVIAGCTKSIDYAQTQHTLASERADSVAQSVNQTVAYNDCVSKAIEADDEKAQGECEKIKTQK